MQKGEKTKRENKPIKEDHWKTMTETPEKIADMNKEVRENEEHQRQESDSKRKAKIVY